MTGGQTNESRQQGDSGGQTVGRRRFLRTGAGVAATALGITALGGEAAAHYPADLEIDVRPGSDQSLITPATWGLVSVAVLQTDDFDPTSEDVRYRFGTPATVEEGGGARPLGDGFAVDVDDDGNADLILFFRTREAGFEGDDTEARLVWEESEAGDHGLAGTDSVTVVGRGGWGH